MYIKYFKTLAIILLCFVIGACSESDPIDPTPEEPENPENPAEPTEPEPVAFDLSENEMANCYIVQEKGLYKFVADNQFNLGEGLPVPPVIAPVEACLVWQSVPGSITAVELKEEDGKPYVVFEVAEAKGNALVAVLEANGNIAWSWHVWMPLENIESVKQSNGYEVMNMNLGALNNTPGDAYSYGTLYQWGRKDPFPAAETLTGTTTTVSAPMYDIEGKSVVISNSSWTSTENNTLAYAISHPTVCLSNFAQYATSRNWLKAGEDDDTLWGNPTGKKTCYDPCPAGWQVPPAGVFSHFTVSGGYSYMIGDFNIGDANGDGVLDMNDYNYGWHFLVDAETSLYFPAAARFDGSYAMLMGSVSGVWGNYWSSAPAESMPGGANSCLAFQVVDQAGNEIVTVSPSAAASRADAFSIRPIRTK